MSDDTAKNKLVKYTVPRRPRDFHCDDLLDPEWQMKQRAERARKRIVRRVEKRRGKGQHGGERVFVQEYMANNHDSLNAYRKAFPFSEQLDDKSVRKRARALLITENVIKMMTETNDLAEAVVTDAMGKYAVSKERVIAELAKIAFSDARDVVEWDGEKVKAKASEALSEEAGGTIAEVVQTKEGIKVKQYSKVEALNALAKHLGLLETKSDKHDRPTVAVQLIIEK